LTDEAGEPVADGTYAFKFDLYGAESGGESLWSEVQEAVEVGDGAFAATLGSANPIPASLLDGGEHWLAVAVRGPGEGEYTALTPRQRLSAGAPAAPASPTNGGACPHDHFGERWQGNGLGLTVLSEDHIGLQGLGTQGTILLPAPLGQIGVYGYGNDAGVYGKSTATGVLGDGSPGVRGTSTTGFGVEGSSDSSIGVFGISGTGMFVQPFGTHGVYGMGEMSGVTGEGKFTGVRGIGTGTDGTGVHGRSSLSHGVYGETSGQYSWVSGVYGKATKVEANGVTGWNEGGGVGVYAFSKSGKALVAKGETGNLIEAWDTEPASVFVFKVTNAGAAHALGGWQGAPDFAELMATEGDAVAYEPGDVLVISTEFDRAIARSSEPNSALVAGVYSENPGFVGSPDVMEGQREDDIPVAVVGIVPCKASAENGPIHRGDLLVTSATPGHAMRAESPAPGTILGKALESLDAGTGVIQVLVTLQ
jgi:hypothetical protein